MNFYQKLITISLSFLTSGLLAQGVTSLNEVMPRSELQALRTQEQELFDVISEVIEPMSGQVVALRDGRNRWRCLGTVIAPEKVVAKWSEVGRSSIFIQNMDGEIIPGRVTQVDESNDLALISAPGLKATPVNLEASKPSQLGDFLIAAGMNARAAGFGVVSVTERSLREEDQAFLGVVTASEARNGGLPLDIVPDGPARRAGLRDGDLLLRIEDKVVDSVFRLRKLLLNYAPGELVKVTIRRAGQDQEYKLKLGGRPRLQRISSRRLQTMNRMGGNRLSRQRDEYPAAIQTDMVVEPRQAGAPVFGLDGRFVGILIARAGRIESYLIPASTLKTFLP